MRNFYRNRFATLLQKLTNHGRGAHLREKMKTKRIIAFFVTALFTIEVPAMDGNELKGLADVWVRNEYRGPNDIYNGGKFDGFIGGVIEAYTFTTFCQPNGVTQNQQFAIITKYLNDNPAKLHLPASSLIIEALNKAFPCPTK